MRSLYKKHLNSVCFTFLISVLFLGNLQAQSSAELKKERERLDREIRQLNQSLKTTSADKSLSLKQVNALLAQMKLRDRKISTINSELKLLTGQIQNRKKSIQELEDQLTKSRKDYEQMVRFAQRNKNSYNKMMFVFASSDFNQAFKRVKFLQQISESRQVKAKEIEDTQAKIRVQVAQLESSRQEQSSLLSEQETEKKEIDAERGQESRVLNSLSSQEKKFQDELRKRQQEMNRLSAAINAAIKREFEEEKKRAEAARLAAAKLEAERTGKSVEEVEKSNPELRKKTDEEHLMATPEAKKLSADFASNRGKFPWPVKNGVVTLPFGKHKQGVNVDSDNEGIRIQTYQNMSVTAVFEGEVRSIIPLPGLGMVVLIKHGKFFTVYGNLRDVKVQKGQKVGLGHILGTAITDSEGNTEIHFELIEGLVKQNPELWLAR